MATSSEMGQNAWPGWEVAVLNDLGAPASKANISFLDLWQAYENSQAHNNPLNLTAPKGDGIATNTKNVQNYATPAQGAMYTANNIRSGMYPVIYQMLKSDSVNKVILQQKNKDIITELNTWGSKTFASSISTAENSGFIPGPGQSTTGIIGHAIASPFEDVGSFFSWLSRNWDRVLFVAGGAILVIIGLFFIFRSQSTNVLTMVRGSA